MLVEIIFIITGFILLIKGADLLVMAATSIAKKFGLSELLIGLTIVALGTSLPEVFVTISASLNNHPDLIIGNTIGSCVCNLLLVIGVASLVHPIRLDKRIVTRHLPIGMIAAVLLLILGNIGKLQGINAITRGHGIFLILCGVLYIVYTVYEEKKIKNKKIKKEIIREVESKEIPSKTKIILYMVLGILGLKFGADFIVDNSVLIAERLGITQKIIGMTIVAVGTALPEIITGIIAAKKDEADLLLGNVSGSNILNLCLLIGLGAVIEPITFITNFNHSIWSLIIIMILFQLMVTIGKKRKIDHKKGIILILIYIIYIYSVL